MRKRFSTWIERECQVGPEFNFSGFDVARRERSVVPMRREWAVTTTLAIAAVAAAAGAGYSAYSSYQQGKAQDEINQYNASLENSKAQALRRDALVQANAQRLQNQKILSKQHAAFAANGGVADTGSPLLIEAQQAGYLEQGALETERTGNIHAGEHNQQAVLDRMQGAAAFRAGQMNAGASILQGTGSLASMGADAQYKGII